MKVEQQMNTVKIQFVSPSRDFTVSCLCDFFETVYSFCAVVQGIIADPEALRIGGEYQAFDGTLSFDDFSLINAQSQEIREGACKVFCFSAKADQASFMSFVGGCEVLFLLMEHPALPIKDASSWGLRPVSAIGGGKAETNTPFQ